jgi:hypothetical protein
MAREAALGWTRSISAAYCKRDRDGSPHGRKGENVKWKKLEVSALVDKNGYVRAIAYTEPSGGKSIVGPLGTGEVTVDGYPSASTERHGKAFMIAKLRKLGYK